MATLRNTRSRNQNDVLKNQPNIGGSKRPRDNENGEGDQRKKRVFADRTNKEIVTSCEKKKKPVKRAQKKAKPKTSHLPKPNKVVAENEDYVKSSSDADDGVTHSQNNVKSQEVSLNVLETSDECASSPESNEGHKDDILKDMVLSEKAKKLLEESDEPLDDVDKEHLGDPFQCAVYACDIFNYYKHRETMFQLSDYMSWQKDLVPHMRGILVDWLVEVQENFELNHETLYLAIKLVDLYLNKNMMSKEHLQLVGATALFIACKFDERCPPMLDDFLYICDDAYKSTELIEMEKSILKSVDFDLGIPLSYRFLRRYSRCARTSIVTLTLSRYILETSQMDYSFIQMRDSLRAAAALLLAMKMNASGKWTNTLVYYTGYTEEELLPLVLQFNTMIKNNPKSKLSTIRKKYSHRVFHEVALIPPLDVIEVITPGYCNSPNP